MAARGHFDIDEDALAGMAGQDIAGEDGEDFIGLVADALFIDHAEAIGIAVPGDTEVGAVAADFGGQVGHGGGILGIGQVMGKGAVEVGIEADHLAADALQRLGAGHRRDAVAGVRHDLERSGQGEPASQERPILLFGVAGGEGAGAAFEIAAVREAAHLLDFVGGQRDPPPLQQFHAVHGHGVVAAGDIDATVDAPGSSGKIQQGRGREADIDHRHPGGTEPGHQAVA